MRILKFTLGKEGFNALNMPKDSVILSAGVDANDTPCIWVCVDSSMPEDIPSMEHRSIFLAPTGVELPDELATFTFIGRIMRNDKIWHAFDAGHVVECDECVEVPGDADVDGIPI